MGSVGTGTLGAEAKQQLASYAKRRTGLPLRRLLLVPRELHTLEGHTSSGDRPIEPFARRAWRERPCAIREFEL